MKAVSLVFTLLFALVGCGSGPANSTNTPAPNTPVDDSPIRGGTAVKITSPDGVVLVGSLFEAAKPSSPALLLLHQWQSDRHSYDDFAKRMQAKGFAVLSIDGRGFGESTKKADGSAISAGRTEADVKAMLGDVGAAFDFLAKQKNVDPARIGIVGASYGSSLALIFAAENPKVKLVAGLSPGLDYFGNMPTEPAVQKYGDRPLLLVAASDDQESADAVAKLKATGGKDKYETKVYEKGGHGTGLFKAKVGLEDLLEGFLMKSV